MTVLQSARRVLAGTAAALLAIGLAPAARAQDYPNQTVKIVVPFVAGGGVDVVARIIAPRLSEELGQPVIIENRGGAGGMLGAAAVAQSPPDGYTFLLGTGSTHGTNSSVYSKLSYDPVRDFAPVALVSTSPLVLIVPPSLPVTSVGELIALARSKPGELSLDHTAPAASITWAPSSSTRWRRSKPTIFRTAGPPRR
jgi:tripartite-type tricarboxylate transporter receptor subunit TctC